MYLTKDVQELYTEHYRIMLRKIKEDLDERYTMLMIWKS